MSDIRRVPARKDWPGYHPDQRPEHERNDLPARAVRGMRETVREARLEIVTCLGVAEYTLRATQPAQVSHTVGGEWVFRTLPGETQKQAHERDSNRARLIGIVGAAKTAVEALDHFLQAYEGAAKEGQ